jgi:hypothetical protein
MKNLLTIIAILISCWIYAQTTISGEVFNSKKEPVAGANVYLEGTYDGSTSDENGVFSFITTVKGTKTLLVSYLSY